MIEWGMLSYENKYFKLGFKNILGGDEAGRGPLAGPISVGVVLVNKEDLKKLKFDLKHLKVGDSKKLSPKQRETVFEKIITLPYLQYACAFESNKIIDKFGIEEATRRAFDDCLLKLKNKPEIILYDGNRPVDKKLNIKQIPIIKGDDKVFIISLASIIAKVTRDRYMVKMAKKYPKYGFEIHKGYGTKKHMGAIWRNGLCSLHRRSYCKGIKHGNNVQSFG
ncbi:MAG TPA: ribonuclease HII [Candidatus Paceibacterota bacterium]|nr:ribonuclease HII [Candidatus Paceibacterota bacterium]